MVIYAQVPSPRSFLPALSHLAGGRVFQMQLVFRFDFPPPSVVSETGPAGSRRDPLISRRLQVTVSFKEPVGAPSCTEIPSCPQFGIEINHICALNLEAISHSLTTYGNLTWHVLGYLIPHWHTGSSSSSHYIVNLSFPPPVTASNVLLRLL